MVRRKNPRVARDIATSAQFKPSGGNGNGDGNCDDNDDGDGDSDSGVDRGALSRYTEFQLSRELTSRVPTAVNNRERLRRGGWK